MSEEITLREPWGGYTAGMHLRVLAAGEGIEPGTIDPARAARLIDQGKALSRIPEAPEEATSSAGTKSPRRRKEAR